MKTGIYMIRNKVNDKAYIGQAVDIDRRWGDHINELNDNKHNNRYLQRAWNKYGEDNFEFTIVCLCEEEELDDFEIDMIAHFDTYNNGYNLTLGGDGARGYRWTEEQRVRKSDVAKASWDNPDIRKNRIEALNSTEARRRKSEAAKKMWSDPERKKKRIKVVNKPEVKKKHSESMKGKCAKRVYCVTNDTVYASLVEAGEKLDINPVRICECCRGKNITKKYPDGHHIRGLEFWHLSEYEEKQRQYEQLPPLLKLQLKYEQAYKKAVM